MRTDRPLGAHQHIDYAMQVGWYQSTNCRETQPRTPVRRFVVSIQASSL